MVVDNNNYTEVVKEFGHYEVEAQKIVIIGGGNIGYSLSKAIEESDNKIITELPIGSSVVINNHFWLHGRKPFRINENLSRELLRVRGSFNSTKNQ